MKPIYEIDKQQSNNSNLMAKILEKDETSSITNVTIQSPKKENLK